MTDTCRSCGAPIRWAVHQDTAKPAPLESDPAGLWIIVTATPPVYAAASLLTDPEAPRYTNHYATCPHARKWRATTHPTERPA